MSLYTTLPNVDHEGHDTTPPDERFTLLGPLVDYTVTGNTLLLYCGPSTLALTLLADDLVRVRFALHGTFEDDEPFSYALDPRHPPAKAGVEVCEYGSMGVWEKNEDRRWRIAKHLMNFASERRNRTIPLACQSPAR